MGEKVETFEVNILSDGDIVKEKMTYNINGTDHGPNGTEHGPNGTLPSISENQPTDNDQLSDKNASISDNKVDDHETWHMGNIFKQVKNLCFSNITKRVERQQRIQKILVSINSVEADLNHLPENTNVHESRCNKTLVENIILGAAILITVAIFMIPMIIYYTGPEFPEIDENMINFFKTCDPVCYYIIINYADISCTE